MESWSDNKKRSQRLNTAVGVFEHELDQRQSQARCEFITEIEQTGDSFRLGGYFRFLDDFLVKDLTNLQEFEKIQLLSVLDNLSQVFGQGSVEHMYRCWKNSPGKTPQE